jgi:hypothetical protein
MAIIFACGSRRSSSALALARVSASLAGLSWRQRAMPIEGQLQNLHPRHRPHRPEAFLVIPGIDSLGSDRAKTP